MEFSVRRERRHEMEKENNSVGCRLSSASLALRSDLSSCHSCAYMRRITIFFSEYVLCFSITASSETFLGCWTPFHLLMVHRSIYTQPAFSSSIFFTLEANLLKIFS